MGEKIGKSWSFNIFSSDKGLSSFKSVVFAIVLTLVVQGVVWVKQNKEQQRDIPVLALNTMIGDIRDFQKSTGRLPKNFNDLKSHIWVKTKTKNSWTLDFGKLLFIHNNYEYVFYFELMEKREVINLWAIPKGDYRESYDTFYVALDKENEEIWKGAALNKENRKFVFNDGFNPTVEEMLALNMVLYKREAQKIQKSFFNF